MDPRITKRQDRGMSVDIVEFHDLSESAAIAQIAQLANAGYRIHVLNVYGDRHDPRYLAVMVRRNGMTPVAQSWRLGRDRATLLQENMSEAAQGWGLRMLSATGPADNPCFAAVYQQVPSIPDWIETTSIDAWNAAHALARRTRRELISADVFGTFAKPAYLGVWSPTLTSTAWTSPDLPYDAWAGFDWTANLSTSPQRTQETFEAQTRQFNIPTLIATDVQVGHTIEGFRNRYHGGFLARVGLTRAQYEQNFADARASGMFPSSVSASGSSGDPRFATIWLQSEQPVTLQPRISAGVGAAYPELDAQIVESMRRNTQRACTVAIARNGQIVYSRGYTIAPPEYPTVSPDARMRIASCSKPITALAVLRYLEQAGLPTSEPIWPLLRQIADGIIAKANYAADNPWVKGVGDNDTALAGVTWETLLRHRTGHEHDSPVFDKYPIKMDDYLLASLAQPVEPTADKKYNNYCDIMAGAALAQRVSGYRHQYDDAVRSLLLLPLGLSLPRTGTVSSTMPDEVPVHHDNLGVAENLTIAANPRPIVAGAYAQEIGLIGPSGGWMMTAPEYARLLAAFHGQGKASFNSASTLAPLWAGPLTEVWDQTWTRSGGVVGYEKGGRMGGTTTTVVHRNDGVSHALFFNGNVDFGIGGKSMVEHVHDLIDARWTPALQSGWRWCKKCNGLAFPGAGSSVCAGGGSHDHTRSGGYVLRLSAVTGSQADWRWCKKCQLLAFAGSGAGQCSAGGGHDFSASGTYFLHHEVEKLPAQAQPGWRWCKNCQALHFTGVSLASCPAGGTHSIVGSGRYRVPTT